MGDANPVVFNDAASARRSLILAGGGMRVAYQAGVVKALRESGLKFQHVDGTSGGTINLAMLLSGLSPDEMCDRWRTLEVRRFASFMPIEEYLRSWDMMGLASADGIREYVFPHLGIDADTINSVQGMSGTFNVCNYSRKVAETIPHQQMTIDLLVAGISLPIFMPPVKIGNDWYTDAVWIKDANLMEAVSRGSEELWVVWCIGNIREYLPGAFHQYVHMIEMAANGRLFEEFLRIAEFNRRIDTRELPSGVAQPIKLHVIKPRYPLPLDPKFFLGKITASTLIEMGYSDACRYLETEMKPEGLPFTPEATQMKSPGVGVTFSKTMVGGFTLGTADPEEGRRRGEEAGTTFFLRMTVAIPDVAAFTSGANQEAELTGNISHPSFGNLTLLKNSVLKPVAQKADPATAACELRFRHGGSEYRLRGDMEVADGVAEGIDMAGVATLRFRVYRVVGDRTEVAGAGVVKLDGAGAIEMVRTMYATNAHTLEQKTDALWGFGKFYLRELWDTHARHLQL
jgi:predicted acylesterase/phospholipase RssA